MSRPRAPDTPFWVDPGSVQGDRLRLDPEETHHLLRVHRASLGTSFEALDGEGFLYRCVLEAIDRRAALGRVLERVPEHGELRGRIEVLAGLPDWSATETLVTLLVPLGVSSIDLVSCERSGRASIPAPRLGRLARIARAGLKQSRRTRMPRILSSASLEAAIREAPTDPRFLADEGGRKWAVEAPWGAQPHVSIAIGPPGGFTEQETLRLRAADFAPICLGPNRLTTESAAAALVTLARNELL